MPITRRTFLVAPPAHRPNILLVMADDFGFACLSANGGTSYQAPHLDQMARSGLRFTHAFAQPLCAPTRLQLMTGQHNFRNYQSFGTMAPHEKTFGHLLQLAGYKTCIAGKWQFFSYDVQPSKHRATGKRPEQGGFDEFLLWHDALSEAHRPRRPGTKGRGTRPSCRAEASPLCASSKKSAQAAQARHQRARNAPLLPGRSESVVREFQKEPTGRAGSAPTGEERAPPAGPARVRCARG
ncbi:MAG: sulfatase-like hydrolase/transferase [Acidobacteriaceae bacterium]|nr:sulfatase-like hydrolase/transferase [Acidobacteriaceae bacterium]